MDEPSAFVSFDVSNGEGPKALLTSQVTDAGAPFAVHAWSCSLTAPSSAWEKLLKTEMARANLCIVIVGWATATAPGVVAEIRVARSLEVPVIGVYAEGTGLSALLPAGLKRNRTVPWRWDLIGAEVTRAMSEGKNGLASVTETAR